jgi:hypothetical protein
MPKKIAYIVRVRRLATGEDHNRLIFASDESTARERAIVRARRALGATFAEREYGQFDVTSSESAASPRRYRRSRATH